MKNSSVSIKTTILLLIVNNTTRRHEVRLVLISTSGFG